MRNWSLARRLRVSAAARWARVLHAPAISFQSPLIFGDTSLATVTTTIHSPAASPIYPSVLCPRLTNPASNPLSSE